MHILLSHESMGKRGSMKKEPVGAEATVNTENVEKAERVRPKRKYKDTIFRMLFQNKKNLLQLYNAVTEKHYEDPEELEIVTLENAVYVGMKNDLAFVIDFGIYLYEHQSTINPNMPYRMFQYISEEYEKLTKDDNLYDSRLVKIPTPHFVVFYNGVDECISEGILKDFLLANKAEVKKMSIYEYDEEATKKLIAKNAYEDGVQDGITQGISQGITQGITQGIARGEARAFELNIKLIEGKRTDDLLKAAENDEYRNKLYEEFNL